MVFLSISGAELKKFLIRVYGFKEPELRKQRKTGSHFKIKGMMGSITLPDHNEIKEGLFNDLLVQIAHLTHKTKEGVFAELKKWL